MVPFEGGTAMVSMSWPGGVEPAISMSGPISRCASL